MTTRKSFLKLPKDSWTCLEYNHKCAVATMYLKKDHTKLIWRSSTK
jgi:hypothetical protein